MNGGVARVLQLGRMAKAKEKSPESREQEVREVRGDVERTGLPNENSDGGCRAETEKRTALDEAENCRNGSMDQERDMGGERKRREEERREGGRERRGESARAWE